MAIVKRSSYASPEVIEFDYDGGCWATIDLKHVMDNIELECPIEVIEHVIVDTEAVEELQNLCHSCEESVIMGIAMVSKIEYPEEPTPEVYDAILSNCVKFYERGSFTSVNDVIGCYETKDVLIYNNPNGIKVIEECERQSKEA